MKLKNYFISGIIIIVPVSVSIWILWKIFIFLEGLIGQWIQKAIPQFYVRGLGFISLVAIILLLGFFAQNVFGKRILRYVERLFLSVPVFNKIYQFVHSIVQQIFRSERGTFREVVQVNLGENISTIGFVATKDTVINKEGEEYWTVFIPTVPNPTTGLVLIIKKDNLKVLPISVEQGMKILLSFGIYNISNATDQNKGNNSEKN